MRKIINRFIEPKRLHFIEKFPQDLKVRSGKVKGEVRVGCSRDRITSIVLSRQAQLLFFPSMILRNWFKVKFTDTWPDQPFLFQYFIKAKFIQHGYILEIE